MTQTDTELAGAWEGAKSWRRRQIGEVLVEQGVLTEDQLQALLVAQREAPERKRLGVLAVEQGLVTEQQIAAALAGAMRLELVDLGRTVPDADAVRMLPRAVAERHGVLVLSRSGTSLRVAVSDPTNVVALDDVRMHTHVQELLVGVAVESDLRRTLSRAWSLSGDSNEARNVLEAYSDIRADVGEETAEVGADDAPVVRLVDALLSDAVRQNASDVHVEPQQRDVRVRFRIDGVLREVMSLPKAAGPSVTSRFKILSGLDISERRRPQDGRARLQVDGVSLDARLSTLPSLHGEKTVIRLLARAENVQNLGGGFEPEQLTHLMSALEQPQGLILITGPTGSGKTSTLYSAINAILSPEMNVVTLEDPVEIAVPGVIQVQVADKAGLTFAAGLRSILRQDPDVVLVGEIRDPTTAELALQASLTGHLVLSTLHTNDAVAAVTRLIDMGVAPFLIASSLAVVVAQRLVRRPCPDCAEPVEPDQRTIDVLALSTEQLAGATCLRGTGCASCGQTGYRGRTGVFEVLPIDAGLRAALLAGGSEAAVNQAARAAGFVPMRQSGIAKALRGETTFEEVLRVTTTDTRTEGLRCKQCGTGLEPGMICCPTCATPTVRTTCGACDKPMSAGWTVCPWCATVRASGNDAEPHDASQPVAGRSADPPPLPPTGEHEGPVAGPAGPPHGPSSPPWATAPPPGTAPPPATSPPPATGQPPATAPPPGAVAQPLPAPLPAPRPSPWSIAAPLPRLAEPESPFRRFTPVVLDPEPGPSAPAVGEVGEHDPYQRGGDQ